VGLRASGVDVKSILPDEVSTCAKLFLVGMIFSGFGDGIVSVVGQLYLISLGFESVALGTILMLKLVGTALITVPAGILADRYGKAKVLFSGFSLFSFAMILFLTSKTIEMFSLAMLLIGLSDAAFVVLGPLYSSFFDREHMDRAFGLQGFLNIVAISVGSLMGFIPPMLEASFRFSVQASYWTLIALATVFFFVRMPFYLMSARGTVEPKIQEEFKFNLKSRKVIAKFVMLTALGRMGYEVFFSLFPFYVNKKFGVKSDALGVLFFISWFVTAGANIIAPMVSARLKALRTIVGALVLCTPFYFMIPLAPNLPLLSALFIIRLGIANLSSPLIASLFMRLLYPEEKATANSINMMTSMGVATVATWLGGQLMEQISLDFPVYMGAGVYIVYAASFYFLLKNESERELEQRTLKEKKAN